MSSHHTTPDIKRESDRIMAKKFFENRVKQQSYQHNKNQSIEMYQGLKSDSSRNSQSSKPIKMTSLASHSVGEDMTPVNMYKSQGRK